ncbi:MAG: hypothetical protein JW810_07565 [Sedimentisphaerales bacterium]|nr:hypothetical protein [Sedimentisphaerales bacterium]
MSHRIARWLGCLVPCAVLSGANAAAVELPRQTEWGRPDVTVQQDNDHWTIQGQKHTVSVDPNTLAITIRDGDIVWPLEGSELGDLRVEHQGQTIPLRLADAAERQITPYRTGFMTGIKTSLNGYTHNGKPLDLHIQLFLCLQAPDEDLLCELVAAEAETVVKECRWPGALQPGRADASVVPFMQGMLLPRKWPRRVWLYDTLSYGRGLYMPWWGYQQANSAALVILETPADGGCHFSHPAGGPTRIGPRWVHSLGRLSYPRRARLCFIRRGDYVDLAKRYRRHVRETGQFVSLKEKIARNPLVADLVGAPVIHTDILVHIQPESSYYHRDDPSKNHHYVTFARRAEQLRALAKRGLTRAYVHLDGWGFRGYDNLHPDILPPSREAGGWEGLDQLARTCEQLGYVFALHDQYRDYYLDAQSYEQRHAVLLENGQRPSGSTWYGGRQSILCPRLAPGHVTKNYRSLLDHGIRIRGAYLDVFAVVPPDECYDPEHPVTRRQCLEYRGDCFDYIRCQVGVVSSEEPADWAIGHLDLVHHGPFALDPNPGHGQALGIPIPLFSLVYHDAILIPWSLGRGAWGIPEKDSGYLHGLAHAGLPYLSIEPSNEELERVRLMCRLNQRLALQEMTGHRFLDDTYRRQQTVFADGTTVTIDLDRDTFGIDPEP